MKSLQERIIHELGVKPEINVRAEIEQRSRFLMRYLGESGMRGFVLGISGGQDSLLAGMLAKRAVNLRHEEGGVAEFHAVLLPYGAQADGADALLAVDTIAPDFVHDINIKPAVDASAQSFTDAAGDALSDFDRGNVKARERMIAQYALASKYGLLVIGTDHAAEAVTGFY
ncbi:MAG: NAD(+) synthase, partial [Candidatus Saccharimonas sp.]